MTISPVRIVLDIHEKPELSWCWRDDWTTGWDSIYSLLSKFAKLNAVDASTLIQIFLKDGTGKKTALIKSPDIDLRNSDLLDRKRISSITRLDDVMIGRAFTSDVFPNGQRKIATFLRWCPQCMKYGFHAAVHQVDYLSSCPLHGERIISECPKCRAQQPYRLNRKVFSAAFSCCRCGYVLSGAIYSPDTKSLRLDIGQAERISDITNLARYADDVLVLAFELDRNSWRRGHGRFAIAKADLIRDYSQYAGFVTSVVNLLQQECRQLTLTLDNVATTGRGVPVLLPNRKKQGEGYKREKARWSLQLSKLYSDYMTIRRYLWRHVIKPHQLCCRSASKKMWWRVNGSDIPQFCPLAEAFLRWRMYWEGCSSPGDLWSPMSAPPRGIVNWIDESSPMFHHGWSVEGEQWVVEHCFVLNCLSTFQDLFNDALKNRRDVVTWDRPSFSGAFNRYWAVCGNDTNISPLVLFTQIHREVNSEVLSVNAYHGGKEHYEWHLKQIALIVH